VVKDSDGVPVASGDYNMRFRLYDAASLGTLLWTEQLTAGNKVTVTNGHYSVQLGAQSPFISTFFDDFPDLWLEVEIDLNNNGAFAASEKFSPRTKFTYAPYAKQADNADQATTADNATQLNSQPASYYRNADNINAGTLSINRFPTNAITYDHLAIDGVHGKNLHPDTRACITVGTGSSGADANAGAAGNIHGNATYSWTAGDHDGCIQAALNYVDATYGAGTVVLLGDTFTVNSQISIPSGCRLQGTHGMGATNGSRLTCAIASSSSSAISMGSLTEISNIYFEYSSGNVAPMIKVPASSFIIEKCHFSMGTSVDTIAEATTSVGSSSYASFIRNNVFVYTVNHYLDSPIEFAVPTYYVTISNNLFRCRGTSIQLGSLSSGAGSYNKILFNRCINNSVDQEDVYAIVLYNNPRSLVLGNLMQGQAGMHLNLGSWHSRIHDNTIRCRYNTTNEGDYGIKLVDSSYTSIKANHITDSEEYGIHISGSSDNCVMVGNIFQGCNKGIYCYADYAVIDANRINSFTDTGIYINSDYSSIQGNVMNGGTGSIAVNQYGISGNVNYSTISGNILKVETLWGMSLGGSDYSTVIGNVVENDYNGDGISGVNTTTSYKEFNIEEH
jgi:parallel beta-helix repeat protein